MKKLILGSPGTGKTTYLINRVRSALEQGVDPARIALVSYTKAATEEVAARAQEQFQLSRNDLPYFRTIHSLCFHTLGLRRTDVLGTEDWQQLSKLLGTPFSTTSRGLPEDAPGAEDQVGDRCVALAEYARAVRRPLEAVWRALGDGLDWWRLRQVTDTIAQYKQDTGKVDFNDMLALFVQQKERLPVDLAIVDEVQDCTAAQWAVLRCAFERAGEVLYAGDDDQAIHEWAGADVHHFLTLNIPREVLPRSYRLGEAVWLTGERLASRIHKRFPKHWTPAAHASSVTHVAGLGQMDPERSHMILARNRYQLRPMEEELRARGLPYRTRAGPSVRATHVRAIVTWERLCKEAPVKDVDKKHAMSFVRHPGKRPWHEALVGISANTREYYRSILRRGHRLQGRPNIYVGTIHSVKGQEADCVTLLTDLSERTHRGMEHNPDAEHRVFYVGATRARVQLRILEPQSNLNYEI